VCPYSISIIKTLRVPVFCLCVATSPAQRCGEHAATFLNCPGTPRHRQEACARHMDAAVHRRKDGARGASINQAIPSPPPRNVDALDSLGRPTAHEHRYRQSVLTFPPHLEQPQSTYRYIHRGFENAVLEYQPNLQAGRCASISGLIYHSPGKDVATRC